MLKIATMWGQKSLNIQHVERDMITLLKCKKYGTRADNIHYMVTNVVTWLTYETETETETDRQTETD